MEAGSVVRAVFEFLPSVSEELPLFTGDVIEVLSVLDEFWLLGNKDGVTGKVSGVAVSKNKIFWLINWLIDYFSEEIRLCRQHRQPHCGYCL